MESRPEGESSASDAYAMSRMSPMEREAFRAMQKRRYTPHRVKVRKTGLDFALAWSVIGIFTVMGVAAIYLASAVLMPLTLAIVVGLILGLAADKLGNLGIPPMMTAFILSSLFAGLLLFVGSALAAPLSDLASRGPAMIEQAVDQLMPRLERISWLKRPIEAMTSGPVTPEAMLENSGAVLSTVAVGITPALVQTLIFFGGLMLFLGSRLSLRKALIIGFKDRARRLAAIRTLNSIERALGFYFATAIVLYAASAVVAAAAAMVGGLGNALLWGLFAFLASFVPFLGITLITLSMAVAGLLVQDSILIGLLPAIVYFTVHGIIENLVTPAVMGRRLEINSFMVFVAIVFWTWMWGAIGAMLAVPLSLIVITIANELLPQTKLQPKLPG
ncbi:AI-2E family transporter [Rhizobium sp. SL42]|uniref:AI-2E family transporter n=1 Tax=Rhizobium sp. SL42 TaxID=2806346 RepID=UPI001F491435|nr:AI-2E family transporter [Rhizobium sp. SL42]UJW76274.1 AI-2E family transporter [Rhizobium sp. SL42]